MTPTQIARINKQTLRDIRKAKLTCGLCLMGSIAALMLSTALWVS
jgi:hypothetical protein